LADWRIESPQAGRLWKGEPQAGHFHELATNPIDDSMNFSRRHGGTSPHAWTAGLGGLGYASSKTFAIETVPGNPAFHL
jgi:hypothetical protein